MENEFKDLRTLFEDEVNQVDGSRQQLVSVVDLSQPDPNWNKSALAPKKFSFWERVLLRIGGWL
jgi:hypothetical protein